MTILSYRRDDKFQDCPQGFLVTGKTNDRALDKLNRGHIRQNRTGHWVVSQGRVHAGDAIFVLLPNQDRRDGYPRELYGGVVESIVTSRNGRVVFHVHDFHQLQSITSDVKPFLLGNVPPQGNTVLQVWDTASLLEEIDQFDRAVERARADGASARQARLASAPRLPLKVKTLTDVFVRNPDVVAEVLTRAKGICQGCDQPAPFLSMATREPYLEVHHKIRLADGGEDTVENAIALCPNCHRKAHYGAA